MIRALRFLAPFSLSLSLVASACSSGTSDSAAGDEPLIEEELVTPDIIGTFRPDASTSLPGVSDPWRFELISLQSDKTFTLARYVTNPTVKWKGQYHFAHNSHGKFLVFVYFAPGSSTVLDTYGRMSIRYELMPDHSLKIFGDKSDTVGVIMKRTPDQAYCLAANECLTQGLSKPSCAGAWSCNANECAYAACPASTGP